MYCTTTASSSESADLRMSVADILSSMANGANGIPDSPVTTTFSSFTGLTSGIPTRTTATLTPTTLKNIEESFLELQSVPPAPMEHQHQAGFVPPVVNIAQYHQQNGSQGPSVNVKQEIPEDEWLPSQQGTSSSRHSSSAASSSSPAPSVTPVPPSKSGRTGGGRRPNRSEKLSPEEEERRRVRRERNKLAAARCRKRRMDHTNSLLKETEGLENRRSTLQNQIEDLQTQKEELEFFLEAHRATCKVLHLKASASSSSVRQAPRTEPSYPHHSHQQHQQHQQQQQQQQANHTIRSQHHKVSTETSRPSKFSRPTSLPVAPAFTNSDGTNALSMLPSTSVPSTEVAGVPIQTPSAGMFSFESLVEGTGLTPSGTTPLAGFNSPLTSCAGQQRSSSSDLSSPDTINPPKLVSL